MNERPPGVFTVKLNAVTSTVPAAPSGVAAEVAAGAPVQLPLRNQSTVTLPVATGLPAPPLTATKSWTVVPTGTVVTAACAALWIVVPVVDGSPVTIVCEPAPEFGGFAAQFELP